MIYFKKKEILMYIKIDKVICLCSIKDIHTWLYSSRYIKKYISATSYEVIVPESHYLIFKTLTIEPWIVISENEISPFLNLEYVKKKIPFDNQYRAGWYLQQLLKIQAILNNGEINSRILIWDSDTIPLRNLNFFIEDKVIFFTGTEHHIPYFDTIKKLLKYDKSVPFSFVSQCLPVYSDWVIEFKKVIEHLHDKNWFDAILDNTNLNQLSGFSEYETLGTFFVNNYKEKLLFNNLKWERNANLLCPIEKLIDYNIINDSPSYVTYESWQSATLQPSLKFKKVKNENEFLLVFFNDFDYNKYIIQVGANDGIITDPLYEYLSLSKFNNISVLLIEPLVYYFNNLKKIYKKRPNTILLNACISFCESLRDFYYIDPAIAFEMNGNGPENNWAHGQGSFYKESIEYWIDQNAFRGNIYIENIPKYKMSILNTIVNCIPLKNIHVSNNSVNLLVIDVQGAELEIFMGIDWFTPPDFIYYEQDIKRNNLIDELLLHMGFEYLCGESNIVMYNKKTIYLID